MRRRARRQFRDDRLPLAARHVFDFPARAHFQAATAALVHVADRCRRSDNLAACRKIGARHDGHQFGVAHLRIADQRDDGLGDFREVMRWDFRGQANGNARGAVEQHEWQARRQHFRFVRGAIVIRLEVDRAHVELIDEQA